MRLFIIVFAGLCAVLSANAAPWTQKDGELYVRSALSSERLESRDGVRADLYGEYGLTAAWTLTAKTEAVRYAEERRLDAEGWRVTARRHLLRGERWMLTAEGGVLQGAAIGGRGGCETLGVELRSGVAWSGTFQGIDSFIHGEVVGRLHDGCERQRAEFGLLQSLFGPVWLNTQFFYESGGGLARSHKTQTELLLKAKRFEIGLGYREETGGVFDESGVFLALSGRF